MFELATAALPASQQTERTLFFVLLQLTIIVAFARVAGQVARRFGQPRVIGEIIGGILLGPSLFGRLTPGLFDFLFRSVPSEPMTILSQIGLVLLMFQIGIEFDFSHLCESQNRKVVLLVATVGILLPFSLGMGLARLSASHLASEVNLLSYELFMATALSITAIPILGRIMIELDLTRTRLGAIAITAAGVNDVIGWILLAAISAMTMAQFSPVPFTLRIIGIFVYFAVCWWLVRPLLKRLIDHFQVAEDHLPQNLLAILLSLIFLSGLATYKLGVFAIFGGFIMGLLLYDKPDFVAAWKSKIAGFITVFFLPIFFTYTGLRTNINGLNSLELWSWCIAVIVVATLGKFAGCYFAARCGGLHHAEAVCLGILMNTRALMELIVINVGYDLGVIPANVFTMLVLMAIFSTIITAPVLRHWLPKMGHVIPQHRDA